MKNVLEEWLNPEGETEETNQPATAASTGVSSTADVESAFDDLFNDEN